MKKIILLLLCFLLSFSQVTDIWAQSSNLNPTLFNWLKFNISPSTHLPYSFYIAPQDRGLVYQHMNADGALKGSVERVITHEGLDIYDAAIYQMVLRLEGSPKDLEAASLVDHYYWQGSVGDTWNIRAGYPINTFIYDPKHPDLVSSDVNQLGKRGFIFRIIDANGQYLVTDPLDGKKNLAGFPDSDRLHWVDWKPVAGENAWVVIAALQLYHQAPQMEELNLAKELARSAMILQSEIGGVRMAPLGTYRNVTAQEQKYFNEKNWWYNHISTENNISWYAAFRMLYQITGDPCYQQAMHRIERFLHFVWDPVEGKFYQGAYFAKDQWFAVKNDFALDVQTWGIACLGPGRLDEWFGQGSAWRMWQAGRGHSGVFSQDGKLQGVGFSDEHDRISVEWSAGAMLALDQLISYYGAQDSLLASKALQDKFSIRDAMEGLRRHLSQGLAAYSYSSRRGKIPFGWNSQDPQVVSLASTGWMIFVDAGFNPFVLV